MVRDTRLFIIGVFLIIISLLFLTSCSDKNINPKADSSDNNASHLEDNPISPIKESNNINSGSTEDSLVPNSTNDRWCSKELFQRLDLEGYDHNNAEVSVSTIKIFDTEVKFCRASNLEGGNLGKLDQWYSKDDLSEIRGVYDYDSGTYIYDVKWIDTKGEECHIRKSDLNFDLNKLDISTIGTWYCGDRIIAGSCTDISRIGQTCMFEDY